MAITSKTKSRHKIQSMQVFLLLFLLFSMPAGYAMKKVQDLSRKRISDLSEVNIKAGIRKVDLSFNQISDLSPLDLPSTVKELRLDNNSISTLNGVIFTDNLTLLGLSFNPIESINSDSLPRNLEQLFLVNIGIDSLNGFNFNKNLELLSIGGNEFKSFNGNLLQTSIQTLFIGGNKFDDYEQVLIPDSIRNLEIGGINSSFDFSTLSLHSNLEVLDIDFIPLNSSDLATINLPPRLKELSFRFTNISDIDSLENIPESLELLDLRRCKIPAKERRRIRRRFKDRSNLTIRMKNQRL